MAYMKPIVERIAANIVSALDHISKTAGFSQNTDIEVAGQAPVSWEHLKIDVTPGTSDDAGSAAAGFVDWHQFFNVTVAYVAAEGTDEAQIRADLFRLAADIYRAVIVDRTRGNLAFDTTPHPPELFLDGIRVPVLVWYRHLSDDPFSQ